jgi:uncharacterized protein YbaR (Trm112 family)
VPSSNLDSLIKLLACPKCRGELRQIDTQGLVCEGCKLFYAIDDGLPNMLIDEAKPWPLPQASGH